MSDRSGKMEPMSDEAPAPGPRPASGRTRRSLDATRRATLVTARAARSGSSAAVRRARQFTHSKGAGESGLSRVLELHAFNAAGDAAIAISLANSVFFANPTDQAVGPVALFLVLTMVPFAVVAPLIGPFLDRFRHGRRWAIGTTFAIRAFCCWVLAGSVADESPSFFLAALACLVASKAYGVTRAAAVPRVLPDELTLVKANSRVSLTGTAAGAISAPLAVGAAFIGSDWSLRYAFVLFVIGTVLAILLPSAVDDTTGEEPLEDGQIRSTRAISAAVVNALRCNSGLRVLSGFLTIYMAFVLRDPPDSIGWDWSPTLLMGAVIGGAGLGSTLGVLIGTLTKSRSPTKVVLFTLCLDVAVLTVVGLFFSWATAILLGVSVGLCQSLGKLSLDAIIQRDVRESVRTSVFARSETLIQLSWVSGGMIGIAMFALEVGPRLALPLLAAGLIAWLVFVLRRALAHVQEQSPPRHDQVAESGDLS